MFDLINLNSTKAKSFPCHSFPLPILDFPDEAFGARRDLRLTVTLDPLLGDREGGLVRALNWPSIFVGTHAGELDEFWSGLGK